MKTKRRDKDSYVEVVVFVPNHLADPLSSYVVDNISSGLILEEAENAKLTGVKFYLNNSAEVEFINKFKLYLSQLVEIHNIEMPEIKQREVEAVDWEDEYRKSILPVEISPELLVRPPWAASRSQYKYEIVIEPKMAFGTGSHETTSNCLKLMQRLFNTGERFLDFGCGTGILSIFADRLQASYIKSVDYDPIAIDNCRENFELNSVSTAYDICSGSIEQIKQNEKFAMVCANVAKKQILEFLESLIDHTQKNGYLVISGLLTSDQTEIETALNELRLNVVEFIQDKEWLTYCIRK